MVFNPYLTEKFRQACSLRKTKTDKIDARIISQMLVSRDYITYSSKSYHISSLKSLTRFRFRLIEARTKLKVRVQNILDLTFPEFPKFFSTIFGLLPMKILSNFPSAENLSKVNIDTTFDFIKEGIRGNYSYRKFISLINAAKSTIGKSKSFNGHMVKRGSPHLRYTLMNVAQTIVNNNLCFLNIIGKRETKENIIV